MSSNVTIAAAPKPAIPRPRTIMVFAPKGGVGKSTLCSNLAVAASLSGKTVAGLDFDGQRAFALWGINRSQHPAAPTLAPVRIIGAHIEDWRDELYLVRHHDVVIIDTPPGVERRNQMALQEMGLAVDLVVMPTEVYGGSMRFVVDFMKWWQAKPGRGLFVLNKTISGRSMIKDAREFLQTRGEVWSESIPQRDDLARAFDVGLAAPDSERIAGHEAFLALWRHCAERIGAVT